MNRQKGTILVFTFWVIWVVVFTIWLCTTATAASYEPDTNYMSQMIATAVAGNVECGRQFEVDRNAKIDTQGLTYQTIAWDNLYLLSKIIYAEAGSNWLSDEWKISVGEVVLNRVASPEFPNTIREVIYQPGQYYGTQSRYFEELLPDVRCVNLALRLLEGERILNDPSVVFQANFTQGSGTHTALYDRYLGWTYLCYSSHPELYL